MLKPIDPPKPASHPEIIEFLRDLLATAYENRIEIILFAVKHEGGMEANGAVHEDSSSRDVDRLLDLLEDWARACEYGLDDEEEDDTGE